MFSAKSTEIPSNTGWQFLLFLLGVVRSQLIIIIAVPWCTLQDLQLSIPVHVGKGVSDTVRQLRSSFSCMWGLTFVVLVEKSFYMIQTPTFWNFDCDRAKLNPCRLGTTKRFNSDELGCLWTTCSCWSLSHALNYSHHTSFESTCWARLDHRMSHSPFPPPWDHTSKVSLTLWILCPSDPRS